MKILDLDNLLICRHKMNNFTKFSFYACNIELDAYGRIYWGTFLGHKTITVSFYALKQTLIFCVTNMSYLWTYGRNVEISVHGKKLFPNISSEQFSTHFCLDKTFYECTYSWHKKISGCFRAWNEVKIVLCPRNVPQYNLPSILSSFLRFSLKKLKVSKSIYQ